MMVSLTKSGGRGAVGGRERGRMRGGEGGGEGREVKRWRRERGRGGE